MWSALMGVMREGCAWLWLHRWHLLVAPVMLIVFTVVHESAHALAAWLQGGIVTEFTVWPTSERWGQIRYEIPDGGSVNSYVVSVAPYLLWAACMFIACLCCLRRSTPPFWFGSTVFVWFYVGAFLDIANAWVGWLNGGANDFANAFGSPSLLEYPALIVVWVAVFGVGYVLQRKLYGDVALAVSVYGVGAVVLSGLVLVVA